MTSYSDTGLTLERNKKYGKQKSTEETSFIEDGLNGTAARQQGDVRLDQSTEQEKESNFFSTMSASIDLPIDFDANMPLLASDTLPSVRREKAKNHLLHSSRVASGLTTAQHSYSSVHGENTPLILSTKTDRGKATFKEIREDYIEDEHFSRNRHKFPGNIFSRCNFKLIKVVLNHVKVALLTILLVVSVGLFVANPENSDEGQILAVTDTKNETVLFGRHDKPSGHQTRFITVEITGPLDDNFVLREWSAGQAICSAESTHFFVCASAKKDCKVKGKSNESPWNRQCCFCLPLVKGCCQNLTDWSGDISTVDFSFTFQDETDVSITFLTDNEDIVPFTMTIDGSNLDDTAQVILAGLILALVYVLIIFEFVHRTMAAIIGSTAALGVLSMLNQRSSLAEVLQLIEWNTIWLLFGMMVLVSIFSQTGFFDWAAVKMYKVARGRTWPLIFLMCAFAGIVSAFLDNVTTILLLTPVSIRLSQVLNLDPRYVLIAEVIFSNIGGTATAIGDPPNVIIVSSKHIKDNDIGFNEFTVHMLIGIIFVFIASFFFLRLLFWACCIKINIPEPQEVAELRRELAIWHRTANRMQIVSLEERAVREALQTKARDVEEQLKEQFSLYAVPTKEVWKSRLSDLEAKYIITNKDLLVRSSLVLLVVIVLFFVSNAVTELHFELGWIAIFGAVTLLMLADIHEVENVLQQVEWGTLVFFAALFVLMELLTHLGLIDFIARATVNLIENVDAEEQMTVAMLLILWVSALASAFIDNIPFTTAIIPVIVDVAEDTNLCVTLRPLVWALAFGACLGGNGTLIGASANVVCAGIAEQNGYPISFKMFFRIGFPMMIFTVTIAMVYLLICHTLIGIDIDPATMSTCVNNSLYRNATAFF